MDVMNRRSFFRSMIGGVAAAGAVRTFPFRVFSFPETISIINPIVPVTTAINGNQILTISMITREALRVLENNLTFTEMFSRTWTDEFTPKEVKIGQVLNIRKPQRFSLREEVI